MANPFLVLGGIAISVATAAFGILQVPGWVKSAQDASAKNDISQITIAQAASLSATGIAKAAYTDFEGDAIVGVKVSLDSFAATAGNHYIVRGSDSTGAANKRYAVLVKSKSGVGFIRIDGGPIRTISAANWPAAAPASITAAETIFNAATAP